MFVVICSLGIKLEFARSSPEPHSGISLAVEVGETTPILHTFLPRGIVAPTERGESRSHYHHVSSANQPNSMGYVETTAQGSL